MFKPDIFIDKVKPELFINYSDIKHNNTIDARTVEEFREFKLFESNIPIINKKEHDFLHKHKRLAGVIIGYGFLKNRRKIKKELLRISENGSKELVIGCSRGRVRSPVICVYANLLGINATILRDGIKPFFEE